MKLGLLVLAAILLDYFFKEMSHWHPLVGFGNYARKVELYLHPENKTNKSNILLKIYGIIALIITVLPFFIAAIIIANIPVIGIIGQTLMLYLAIGSASLKDHALAVKKAIQKDDIDSARQAVGKLVSRDANVLDMPGVIKATIESTLENGSDAIFAPIFWFMLLGGSGAVLYRLVNTLDAMWGYRNERYNNFGWAAAKFDDLLNWVPARLTAMTYIIFGDRKKGIECFRTQAKKWYSPNAGPVMAAGAGALDIQLGGGAQYHNQWKDRPILGTERQPQANDIDRSISLIKKGLILWTLVAVFVL